MFDAFLAGTLDAIPPIADVVHDARKHHAFEATPVHFPLSPFATVGDFRRIGRTKPETEADRMARSQALFIFHYTHPLEPDHPMLLALADCVALIRRLGSVPLVYVTPVNVEAGRRWVGTAFGDALRRNVGRVLAAVAPAGGAHAADFSMRLPDAAFFHEDFATEHLNIEGRRQLADLIVGLWRAGAGGERTGTRYSLFR